MLRFLRCARESWKVNTENQTAAGQGGCLKKITATEIHDGVHLAPPCAFIFAAR